MSEQEWDAMGNAHVPTEQEKSNSNKAAVAIAVVLFMIGLAVFKTLGF